MNITSSSRSSATAPKRKCPSCGKLRLRKLISAAAFHLKGDGWYVTDFRDKGKHKDKGKPDAAESSSDSKAGSKSSDSKLADSKSTDTKGGSESKTSTGSSDSSRAAWRGTVCVAPQTRACFFSSLLSWWYPSPSERAVLV